MEVNRRQFLQIAGACTSGLLLPQTLVHAAEMSVPQAPARHLKLLNIHTGERANVTYWENGQYLVDGLSEVFTLMRDHRRNEVAPIDLRLLDRLYQVTQRLETQREISLISGYRSPATNKTLRHESSGVAEHSLHMSGKAMDFRIPGLHLGHVHKAVLASGRGGVGYYQSGFLHMDVGSPRHWRV
ncbi:MAG: DUF882 domain-containing protein [Oceanospirillaceae bacterium]|nr:DUF882 domain-containing protein [Oceanospirillaceae bacterium]MCP5350453.1 DUF882 domain-containing protein [Oceanospirillaceae bacterium]